MTAVVQAESAAKAEISRAVVPEAMVRWTTSVGKERIARASLPLDAEAGDHVTVWVDGHDGITDPPQDRIATVTEAIAVAFSVVVGAAGLLLLLVTVVRLILDRTRLADWESAWTAADARWRRHRQT